MTREEAIQLMSEVQFGYLATIGAEDSPCVRPVSIKDVYGDDVYFFTFCTTSKVAEMAANPHVQVVWAKADGARQVRVSGLASVVTDPSIIERFKADNPMVERIVPEGAQQLFRLYKIEPERVEAAEGLVPYATVDW